MKRRSPLDAFLELFAEDDGSEAVYDPVHLGGVLIGSLVAVGALYWLLWTLLVFEGGLFVKISALLRVAFTGKTLADFGYGGGPHAMGVFEGWAANLIALLLAGVVVAALHRLHHDAARKHQKKKN